MGICSGVVTYRNGQTASGIAVRGAVHMSGMTRETRTDRDGRFTLEWSSDSMLASLYVDGREVERNVRTGSRVHATLTR
jgi:hypothetical protein